MLNHKTQERKQDTLLRAKKIIEEIEFQHNRTVLVVTHGAFMTVLRNELKRRGYIGEQFTNPLNGKVYLYEKKLVAAQEAESTHNPARLSPMERYDAP